MHTPQRLQSRLGHVVTGQRGFALGEHAFPCAVRDQLNLILQVTHRRFWPAPSYHHLAHRLAVHHAKQRCLVEAHLSSPGLVLLWDHRVGQMSVLPGSAMLDMAVSNGHAMTQQAPSSAVRQPTLVLTSCAIQAPVLLSLPKAALLHIDVSLTEGSFVIRDITSEATQVHMSGRFSAVRFKEQPSQIVQVRSSNRHAIKDRGLACLASVMSQRQAHIHTECIASILFVPQSRTDGHLCHPAVMDGCLHLATSLLQPHGKGASLAVPAGMRSMVAEHVERLSSGQSFSASCCTLSLAANQRVHESNHVVLGPSQSTGMPAARIAGLRTRAAEHMMDTLRSASAKQRDHTLVEEEGARHDRPIHDKPVMLYRIVWEAARMAGQSGNKSQRRPQVDAMLVATSRSSAVAGQVIIIPMKGKDAVTPLGQLLSHFQQMANHTVLRDLKVSLSTTGVVLPSRCLLATGGGAASAASWGMLRVAANEAVSAKWDVVDQDCASGKGYSMTDATDVYGLVQKHNVALQPVLYPWRVRTAQRLPRRLALPLGTVLVTGGLGGSCRCACRLCSVVADVLQPCFQF